jgi:glyoxylase-like metal-dependent hydrolase (beta-lactamase superfamily II)
MTTAQTLPAGLTVLERGWLSSNNIVLLGDEATALVDSGYCTHAPQTLALVEAALAGRKLDVLINTHLHSDHCGGNAALQARYPDLQTHIPPGQAAHVADWNPVALSYTPTGQACPPYRFDHLLQPGREMRLGAHAWQVHAAPGHDPHSVILFEPGSRTLVSADALWQRGFGVVFPELDGQGAFDEVAATLDLIESLAPEQVIPGHGAVFTDVPEALHFARQRLNGFVQNPQKHLQYASKVLIKFKLLDAQRIRMVDLRDWVAQTAYVQKLLSSAEPGTDEADLLQRIVSDLERSGAARVQGGWVFNA